jgi:hypothetical protein
LKFNVGVEVCTTVVIRRPVFWDKTAYSPLLATSFMLVSYMAYFLTLKMEAICSSKTLVDFQQTAQYYIPKDRILLKFGFITFLGEKMKLSLYMEMEHDVDHIKFYKFHMNYLMWCVINKI